MRISLQPAYLLHTRHYRESSLLLEALTRAVVEVHVRHLALARHRLDLDAEAVVLRRDLDSAGLQIEHGLIDAAMPIFQLEGFRTACERQKLVA